MRLNLIISLTLLLGSTAWAFPELVRHNYANCMACHISPTGGGVVSEYGRSLSKELVSTWGYEGEEKYLYFIPISENYALGGDFRWMKVRDKPKTGDARERWIHMQKDLEVAITIKKWVGAVTVGENTTATEGNRQMSRRHYLMHKHNDEMTLRGGRFYPSFGLHIPDHTSVIRRGLGWDQGQETYNLEGAYQGEKWHFFATAIFGRPDDHTPDREKGLTLTTAYHTKASSKLGVSYYYGESPDVINHFLGPFVVIPFGEKLYLMGQVTAIRSYPYTADEHQWGLVDYLRFNWEAYKGIHLFLEQQMSQTNLNSQTTRNDIQGVGFQFFPRPHWEFQAQLQKVYAQGMQSDATERLNLLFHFYP